MNIPDMRLLQEADWNSATTCTSSCRFRRPQFSVEYQHGALLCELSYTSASDTAQEGGGGGRAQLPPPLWKIVRTHIVVSVVAICDTHHLFHVHTMPCPELAPAAASALDREVENTPQYRAYQKGLRDAQQFQQTHNTRAQMARFLHASKVPIILRIRPNSAWGSHLQFNANEGICTLALCTRTAECVCPVTGCVMEHHTTYCAASLPTGVWFSNYMTANKDANMAHANIDFGGYGNADGDHGGGGGGGGATADAWHADAVFSVDLVKQSLLLGRPAATRGGRGHDDGWDGDASAAAVSMDMEQVEPDDSTAMMLHRRRGTFAIPRELRCRVGSRDSGIWLVKKIEKTLTSILYNCDNGRVPQWVTASGATAKNTFVATAERFKHEPYLPLMDMLARYAHEISHVGVYGSECNLARITYYTRIVCQVGAIVAHAWRESGGLCTACTNRLDESGGELRIPVWCPANALLEKVILGVLTIMATTGYTRYVTGDTVASTAAASEAPAHNNNGGGRSAPAQIHRLPTRPDENGLWGTDTGVRYVLPRDVFVANIVYPLFSKRTQNERMARGPLTYRHDVGGDGQKMVSRALEYAVVNSHRDEELGVVSRYLLECLARTVTWYDPEQLEMEARDMGAL